MAGATSLAHLTEDRRVTALARLAFIREIERLSALTGKEAAIRHLVQAAKAGTLGERLAQLIPVANAKFGAGEARGLSRRRLYEWCALYAEGGELALAPHHPHKDMGVPAWASLFLSFFQRPQNPSLAEAHRDGFAITMFGRRRPIPELASSNFNLRSFGERTAMNHPMQGSAADIMKLAMIEVDRRLRAEEFSARMVLQVHDELVFEAPPEELERLSVMVREAMGGVTRLAVPLEVTVGSGSNWASAK